MLQAAQAVIFLTGSVGIKIAIAKILGIADDVRYFSLFNLRIPNEIALLSSNFSDSCRNKLR